MRTTRERVRLIGGVSGLLLSLGLARSAHAQDPPAPGAAAQSAVVSGVVVDSAGIPIGHAAISLVGQALRAITDSAGRFHLEPVPPGLRLFSVRALGYRPHIWSRTVEPGQSVKERVGLERLDAVFVLPELTVVGEQYVPSRLAGFYQRRQFGIGKFFDREYIDRRSPRSMSDLLLGLAGVRVWGNIMDERIGFVRCARIGVYVDGFRLQGDPSENLRLVNPAYVEAMEIYRGPSELPAEFMSDDCAAIVVWTR
jgi:hypothetical protein